MHGIGRKEKEKWVEVGDVKVCVVTVTVSEEG